MTPSKPACRTDPSSGPLRAAPRWHRAGAPARRGDQTAAARAACAAARPTGAVRSMPKSRLSACSASRTSLRSPRAQGAIAPSASDFDSSGTTRCGSKSTIAPRPWHSGQAPCGELNEKARGVISGMLMPQSTQASRRENSRSPPSSVLMTTMSSARLSATSTDSVSRRSTRRDDQAIDDHLDRVVAAPVELDVLFERAELAVDARLREPAHAQRRPAPS